MDQRAGGAEPPHPGADRRPISPRAGRRYEARPRDALPVRRWRPRRHRVHLLGQPGLLHDVQPDPSDRRRRAAHVPLLAAGDAAARPDAVRRLRRSPRRGDRVRDLAQRGRPPDQQARLHQTGEKHVPNRRLTWQISPPHPVGRSAAQPPGGGDRKLIPVLKPEEAQRPYTVTELANEIRRELRPLTAILLKGEVSGMKRGTAGHYNFSIQDGLSRLDAVLFADDSRRVTTLPEDGQVFIFRGRVDFFGKTGRLSFIVDQVEFDDVGKLRARLEELKRRLELEGAFDPKRKRSLPFLPHNVALLTSPTGAVINDLQETIWDRYPNMGIVLYPVQVQGAGAPMSVARALRRCNQEGLADVIVLARGGGSCEEMYAFNTELVARAILESRLPVVTALGHTSDRTVSDLVGDAECRTPTEAGARVVPKKSDLIARLGERGRRLDREITQRIAREAERLAHKRERMVQLLPSLVRQRADRLARAAGELGRLSPIAQVARREDALRERARRIDSAGASRLARSTNAFASRRAVDRLERALSERFAGAIRALGHREQRLAALSPDGVLARGYSITLDAESGTVIRSAAATKVNRRVRIRPASGRSGARVEEVET